MNISDYLEDSIDGIDDEEEIPQWILHLSFLVRGQDDRESENEYIGLL